MNPSNGRFFSIDTFQGFEEEPLSLHKYLYTHSGPINHADPTGHFQTEEITFEAAEGAKIEVVRAQTSFEIGRR